ncbi:MAG: hypothetical protein AB1798_10320, partial [Spirochaetota bacterium]
GRMLISDFRDTRVGRRIGAAHREEAHGPFSISELESLFVKLGLRDVRVSPVKHWVIGVGTK